MRFVGVLGAARSVVEDLVEVVLGLLVRQVQVDLRESRLVARHRLVHQRQPPLLLVEAVLQLALHQLELLDADVLLQIFQRLLHLLARVFQDLRSVPLPLCEAGRHLVARRYLLQIEHREVPTESFAKARKPLRVVFHRKLEAVWPDARLLFLVLLAQLEATERRADGASTDELN